MTAPQSTDQQLTQLGAERFNVPAILRFIDAEAKSAARLVRALDLARLQAVHERDCAVEDVARLVRENDRLKRYLLGVAELSADDVGGST